jgi:hypothetical protein
MILHLFKQMGLAPYSRVAVPLISQAMRHLEYGGYFWAVDGEKRLPEANPGRTSKWSYGHDVERRLTEKSIKKAENDAGEQA